MEKGKLLERMGASGDERLVLARVLDRLEQAERRSVPAATDFLTPAEQAQVRDLLRLADVGADRVLFTGGFPGAERQLALFLPDWLAPEDAKPPLRLLRASYRPEYALTHRDLLGSLMGAGIAREKIGDLLVGPESCDLAAAEGVADFLLQSWESAGRAPLRVAELAPEAVQAPQERCEELRDTVSSLRLDAVVGVGFRLSRSKASALIEGGRVQVNWRDCVKPDHPLTQGDTVTARGLGKFVLDRVEGTTKKGRTAIVVRRML